MSSREHSSESQFNSLVELLSWRATQQPDQKAFIFLSDSSDSPEASLTYGELHSAAQRIAALILDAGGQGQNVLLCQDPGLDYVAAFFGCLYAGAVAVPAYPPDWARPQRTMPRLRAIIENADARLVLTQESLRSRVAVLFDREPALQGVQLRSSDIPSTSHVLPAEVTADNLAFLMYTSGSTGEPKGVMVTHGNVLHNLSHFRGFDTRPCRTIVSWLPLFHDLGLLLGVLHPVYQGVPAVLMAPATFVRRPYRWLAAVSDYHATTTGGPNFAYELCLKEIKPEERARLDLSSWNMALNGAEPVRAETLARFAEVFGPCGYRPETAYPSYGMAEGTATVTGGTTLTAPVTLRLQRRALEQRQVLESESIDDSALILVGCGKTLPEQEVRIVDPELMQECPPDGIGEIWVSGPSVAQGYWRRPDDTADSFGGRLAAFPNRTFLRTGDLGFLRQDELFIAGRLKDVVIIRGVNHYPEDLEHTIGQCHPALRPGGGAVFSVDVAGSERLVVIHEIYVEVAGELDAVFGRIRQSIAELHDLEVYAIWLIKPGALLKTSSGKIRRKAVREAFLANSLPVISEWRAAITQPVHSLLEASTVPAEASIREWLVQYFARRQGMSATDVAVDQPFARYGMGSLESLTLVHDLEQWLQRSLAPTLAWDYPTIDSLARYLADQAGVVAPTPEVAVVKEDESVAIVGMSCRFPGGANSPEELWEFLVAGGDAVKEIGLDRWDVDTYYHPQHNAPGKMITRWGAHLENLDLFDAAFFGISPREAAQLDPRQRLVLEGAWEALEDAGIPVDRLSGTQGAVFMAVLQDDYGERVFDDYSIINAYSGSGTANTPVANRISYFLDLHGPSAAIDTACSGSLVAIHMACQSLLTHESSLALAGGVNIILEPDSDIFLSQAGIISPDGRCKTFDRRANGIARAEGMGILVLKRLSQAQADGDRIYAVIRGSAVNHCGRSNGLMAPSGPAQELVVRTAQERAGIRPHEVQYLEAHGTGTALGDPIEVNALGNILTPDYPAGNYCALGSIKTNIGHAEAAAGVAGLIKVVMSMQHGLIPPNLHFREANPLIPFDKLPLVVQQTLGPWPRPDAPLIAGVSGFGFSGTNAHVVLEAASRSTSSPARRGTWVVPLSAKTPEALLERAAQTAAFLRKDPGASLYDVGYTAAVRRNHLDCRLAAIGSTRTEIADALDAFAKQEAHPALRQGMRSLVREPKRVFVFSGQGTQWLGMGRELSAHEPVFRATLDVCDRILRELAGWSLLDELTADEAHSRLDDTTVAQPAIFAMQVALAALWRSWGLTPDAIVGQSLGEVAAAHVAGALTLEDALKVVYHRSRLMKRVEGQGLTAVIGLPMDQARLVIMAFSDVMAVAGSSSPTSSVISGAPDAVQRIVTMLDKQGTFARLVQGVTIAFHSPQMDPLVGELVESLAGIKPRPAVIPLFSTVLGTLVDGAELNAAYWGRNLRDPFVFSDVLRQLAQSDYDTYLEVSPHPVLGGPITQGLAAVNKHGLVLASLKRNEGEQMMLLQTLGTLYTLGHPVNWSRLYAHRGQVVKLPTYPWQREHYWLDQIGWTALADQISRRRGSGHPLLGEHLESPVAPWQHFWGTHLEAHSISYLTDHLVRGMVVMPGAVYLEMAQAAAQQAFGEGPYRVSRMEFKQALYLPEKEPQRVQIVLTPEMPGEASFQVFSTSQLDPSSDEVWTEHVSAMIRSTKDEVRRELLVLDLEEVRRRCKELIPGKAHFQAMEKRGLSYGPAFQGIQEVWRRDGEALGRLKLPELLENGKDVYQVHPVLLDAGFQVVALTLPMEGEADDATFLPAGVGELRIYRQAPTQLWCWAQLKSDPVKEPDVRRADLVLVDNAGEVVAEIRGLRLQRAAAAKAQTDVTRWFYEVHWQPQVAAPVDAGARRQPGSWLIFTTQEKDPLAMALVQHGERCIQVHPGDAYRVSADGLDYWIDPAMRADYDRLLKAALTMDRPPCRGVIHRWAESLPATEDLTVEGLGQVELLTALSGVTLVQALSEARLIATPRLWLVTAGAQAVVPWDRPVAAGAPLWGLGRVMASEVGELRTVLIDLPAQGEAEAALFEEIWAGRAENQVALRAGIRYVARLARYDPVREAHGTAQPAVSSDAPFRLEVETPGVLESLTPRAVARPKPGPGQVEVEVLAVGLNFKDVMLALGMLPPLPDGSIPLGLECAGRISAVGPDVKRVKVGDEVLVGGDRCFSRYVITSQHLVGLKPAGLSFEAASTLLVAFATTHYAMNRLGRLQKGERILIHTASGAVGQAAIQLAKLAGAEIYATAGTPEKRAFVRDVLGVSHVLDSRTLDFAEEIRELTNGEGVDVVLNTLGGAAISRSLELLKPYGRFLELGKRDIVMNSPLRMGALERNISYFVVDLNQMMRDRPEMVGEMIDREILPLFADGRLQPLEFESFPVSRAAEAFHRMAKAQHIGKLVVTFHELPAMVAPARVARVTVQPDATYLITGGLGGLGYTVAEWLVRRGARHLVLTSRRSRSELSGNAADQLAALEAMGVEVRVARNDVTRAEEVQSLMAEIAQTMPPLRGVIHSAGVLDDGLLVRMSRAQLEKVLAPKVRGAWNLHAYSREAELDFFVLFSSLAAILGPQGQANYAAGNAFMDALAQWRRAAGLPGLSLNWGPWAEVGMAARQGLGAQHAAGGVLAIEPAAGLLSLEQLIDAAIPQAAVAAMEWPQMRSVYPAGKEPPFLADLLAAEGAAGAAEASQSDFVTGVLTPAAPDKRRGLLESYLQELAAGVLHLERNRLNIHQPLSALGIDSIMAVELKAKVEKNLGGVTVSIADLLRGLSVADLAERFMPQLSLETEDAELTELLAEADDLSDEELSALLDGAK